MPKFPSFNFYPGDWLKDPELSICSLAARGMWIDVICLMFECRPRGYLFSNGRPWTLEQTACAIRGDWQENLRALKELVQNGVMKQDKKRRFFSKKLVKIESQRAEWRAKNHRNYVKRKEESLQNSTAIQPPSSFSSSNLNTKTPLPPVNGGQTGEQVFSWAGQTVAVQMGRHRRLPSTEGWAGMRADDVARTLTAKGFPARVVGQ